MFGGSKNKKLMCQETIYYRDTRGKLKIINSVIFENMFLNCSYTISYVTHVSHKQTVLSLCKVHSFDPSKTKIWFEISFQEHPAWNFENNNERASIQDNYCMSN